MDAKGLGRDVFSSISNTTLSDAGGTLEEWIAGSDRLGGFFSK